MKNVVVAVAVSFALHACLAVALAFGLPADSAPDVAVTLDLAHVELSFAEQEDDTASAAAPGSSAAPADRPPRQPAPEPPSPDRPAPSERADSPEAPDAPEDPSVPAVPEPPEQMETPQAMPSQEATPVAPRQAKVDAPPRPRTNIRPDYPKAARERGEQGDVLLEISVGAEGNVDDVAVVSSSGFAELDEAAARAARRARFAPAKSGGRPVASRARLKLEFKLK